MKTVDVLRRENLHILASESGGPSQLADDLCKSKSQISQWLNASPDSKTGKPRTISNASAREIEGKKGKPFGWMDTPHPTGADSSPAATSPAQQMDYVGAGSPEQQEIINEIASREIPEGIREAILTLIRSSPKKKNTG